MDETSEGLRSEIAHLRRLAAGITDQQVKDAIAKMIEELERRLEDPMRRLSPRRWTALLLQDFRTAMFRDREHNSDWRVENLDDARRDK